MKKNPYRLILAALLGLLFSGCFPEKKVFWSPDGQTAALIVNETLYFCDGEGKLSTPFMSNVVTAAWLANSQDLIVEYKMPAKTWIELTNCVGPAIAKEVADAAKRLLPSLQKGAKAQDLLKDFNSEYHDWYPEAIRLYLRDCCQDQLENLSPTEEMDLQKEQQADVEVIQRFKYSSGQFAAGQEFSRSLNPALELRPSPQGKLLAYATPAGLFVTPEEGGVPPRLVETNSIAWFFDWTADGKSLVYIKSGQAKNKSDLTLGVLARRQICNDEGNFEPAAECEDLAGVLFDEFGKVRCLKDGRILFTSMPLQLPATVMEMPQREQLYALDPVRYHSAIRLIPNAAEDQMPKRMSTFEISPNGKSISALLDNGGVAVFHLDTGAVDTVQSDRSNGKCQLLPTWKSNDELCFGSIADEGKTNQMRMVELALWQNGKERLLSSQWPAHIIAKLFDDDNAAKPSSKDQ